MSTEQGTESERPEQPNHGIDGSEVGERTFGGLSPSEAGKRSAEARRKKRDAEAQEPEDALRERRSALESKAKKGDVNANRELRENHDYYYGDRGADIWTLLTPEQRTQVSEWLGSED